MIALRTVVQCRARFAGQEQHEQQEMGSGAAWQHRGADVVHLFLNHLVVQRPSWTASSVLCV
jgi:hypothetical protein